MAKTARKIPQAADQHVGLRVRLRRQQLGMSQEKLGDHCGLTFQQIQKYEKGTNRMGASRLQQVSDILKVPVAYFFEGLPGGGSNKLTEPDPLTQLLQSSQGIELMKGFLRIEDVKVRRLLVALVSAIGGDD